MKIISILNQKGGTGKTTTTTNLAYSLKLKGYKVLIVDSDPQGSSRDWNNETGGNVVPVIGLDRPSLAKDIQAIGGDYDFIVIDGAPQLSNQMIAAIKVSNMVVIPVQPSPYDVWATGPLVEAIQQRQELGVDIKSAFIISRAIKNTNLAKEVKEVLQEYNIKVFGNGTTQRVSYSNSAANGETVFQTNDKKAQNEVLLITDEILEVLDVKH